MVIVPCSYHIVQDIPPEGNGGILRYGDAKIYWYKLMMVNDNPLVNQLDLLLHRDGQAHKSVV